LERVGASWDMRREQIYEVYVCLRTLAMFATQIIFQRRLSIQYTNVESTSQKSSSITL